jgi:hypothetical protein
MIWIQNKLDFYSIQISKNTLKTTNIEFFVSYDICFVHKNKNHYKID